MAEAAALCLSSSVALISLCPCSIYQNTLPAPPITAPNHTPNEASHRLWFAPSPWPKPFPIFQPSVGLCCCTFTPSSWLQRWDSSTPPSIIDEAGGSNLLYLFMCALTCPSTQRTHVDAPAVCIPRAQRSELGHCILARG